MGGVNSNVVARITREAARDLSDYQYHAMKIDSNGRIDYADTSSSDVAVGILQNKPDAAYKEAEIAILGTSLMRVTGSDTISITNLLGSDSSYHGKKVTADEAVYFAMALEAAAADDDLIEVLLLGHDTISTS